MGLETLCAMAHARIRPDRRRCCPGAFIYTVTCFEFTSMRHEESSEVEKVSHYADSVRSLNLFLSSTISSIRFNVSVL